MKVTKLHFHQFQILPKQIGLPNYLAIFEQHYNSYVVSWLEVQHNLHLWNQNTSWLTLTPPAYIKSKEIMIGVLNEPCHGCDWDWIDNNIFVMHNITNTKQHLDPKSCRQLQWPNEYNIPSLKALHPMTTPCPPFLSKCVPHKTPTTSTKHKKLPITKKTQNDARSNYKNNNTHNKKFQKKPSKFQSLKSKRLHRKIQRP